MFDDPRGYPVPTTQASLGKSVSYRAELTMRIDHLTEALDKQKRLLKLIDENPQFEEFMDLNR